MNILIIGANALLLCAWFSLSTSGGAAAGAGQQSAQKPASSAAKPAPSADALDRLLAPIALYPDQLLAQMLLCASNPGKVAALEEWMAANEALKGTELQDAAIKSGFEPPFAALVLFPQVVAVMAGDLKWTTQVGEAFAADRSAVFGSIQRLRTKAKNAGTLKSTPQQDVETKTTSSGQQVIVIEPANPQVVYVPQYNPQAVYTSSSTVVVQQESSSGNAVAAGLIGFTAGIAIGAAIDNDYYYGPYGWRGGAYMYDDAWDDWYDAREDAREDWQDHREDLYEERGDQRENLAEERSDRASTAQEQRTERAQTGQQARPESQAQRAQRRTEAQGKAASAQGTATQARTTSGTSQEARGYSRSTDQATRQRSGTSSDAFSGYSNGRSERAASERGQKSRSSSRSSGSRRR
jgi:Protein of unknown function (DUF3300)